MWFRGCQYEYSVGRRLLQGLKEGIGRLLGYHVDLVYDIDLVASQIGSIIYLFSQVTNFIDAPVARGVYFYYIGSAGFVY
jgi:hypothetical protein